MLVASAKQYTRRRRRLVIQQRVGFFDITNDNSNYTYIIYKIMADLLATARIIALSVYGMASGLAYGYKYKT